MSALRLHVSTAGRVARRLLLVVLLAASAAWGITLMSTVLGTNTMSVFEAGIAAVFAISFTWISLSFWVAIFGVALNALRRDPVRLDRAALATAEIPPLTKRTAVLMPIYNEDTRRVFAGLAATYRSLEATGRLEHFDFFVLSDTTDPDVWLAEEALWYHTVCRLSAGNRLFYRHRARNEGRKSGNIGDWVQRWGGAYETMVVFDADSVMSGDTLVRLAALMEANPKAGIIQTLAVAANRTTLFARALQFASRLYGGVLATGHSFWQLSEANYYGHNAIIRTAAFAAHCGLPKLSGRPPLGGEILSHDFVEAACMRRGGWQVWFLPELGGSFEEVPSNLIDYAVRDRRWAQGNLQHMRLLLGRGLHTISRLHLGLGVLAFFASPLWMLLLALSTIVVISQTAAGHAFFAPGVNLFPIWPEYRPVESLTLLGLTIVVLFLPKLLTLALVLARPAERRAYGGGLCLTGSVLAELLFSMLLAPVMMLFHTTFVATILAGRAVGWGAQPRDDRGVDWASAFHRHRWHTLIGAVWGGAVAYFAPAFLWWVAPVVLGMLLATPTNVISSRSAAGLWAQRRGLFLTPEETATPPELRFLREELAALETVALPRFDAVLDEVPLTTLHRLMAHTGSAPSEAAPDPALLRLAARAAADSEALQPAERRAILDSPDALASAQQLRRQMPAAA